METYHKTKYMVQGSRETEFSETSRTWPVDNTKYGREIVCPYPTS